MPHLDRANRRLELKLVYWGPARGGKTTSLRSLHGACDAAERGELSSVDTEDERTYYFDYAPMNLPRYRDFAIRVNAYTVPGQEAYVETRRRILRGADAVIFVADCRPEAQAANLSSWRQLDDCLRAIEGTGAQRPVIIAANKQDVPGAIRGDETGRRLATAVPARSFVDLVEATAVAGKGVVRCFRSALVAASSWPRSTRASAGAPTASRSPRRRRRARSRFPSRATTPTRAASSPRSRPAAGSRCATSTCANSSASARSAVSSSTSVISASPRTTSSRSPAACSPRSS
jgi:signal recognition particle receptor subunit beta